MPVLPTNAQTLLTGLSDFWQRFFADKDQLNVMYAATEELLGQAYLDIVTEVLNVNLDRTPLFNREYWHLLAIREDDLFYAPGEDWPYRYQLQDGLREFVFLLNRIYDPTVSFEIDVDFVLAEGGELQFKVDPFTQTDGVPVRLLDIEPTVYRTGNDGVVGAGPTSTFTILGNTQEGNDGQVPVTDRFTSPGATFTTKDIGRKVFHTNTTDHTLPQEERTITGILNSTTVFADPPALATSPGALQWAVRDDGYFDVFDVGRCIALSNPALGTEVFVYEIASVVPDGPPDDTSLVVTFTTAIDPIFHETARLQWSHQSKSRVRQAAYWVPDAMFDRQNLYLSFGYLINRFEPSTESYRALISGIFRYFMLGPSLARIESALNVMVGVPVVRTDGEVVQTIDVAPSGLQRVTTDLQAYEIPLNSLDPAIEVGTELRAFQVLTTIFQVDDYISDPTWYYGATIPTELLPGPLSERRVVDPKLYPLVAGTTKWVCGDPDLYCGADESGVPVPRQAGADVYHTGNTTRFRFAGNAFVPEDVGKEITIEGVTYTISAVATDPNPYINVTDGVTDPLDLNAVFLLDQYTGTTPGGGDVMSFASASFVQSDVGRLVDVWTSTAISLGLYRISKIVSATQVRVVDDATGAAVTLPADPLFIARLGLQWTLESRPALRHNTGYIFMQKFLKTHIFQVSYSFTDFPDLPHPRPEDDIRNVLDAGKSSYTYMLVVARNAFLDQVEVRDSLFTAGLLEMDPEVFQEVDWKVTAGGGSVAGEFYAYSRPAVAWMGSIRRNEFASITAIPQSDTVEKVVVSAAMAGGVAPTLTVTFYAWTGMAWVPTGDVVVLDPLVSNIFVANTFGNLLGISVVESGAPTSAGVAFGLISEEARTVIFVAPVSTSLTGEKLAATNHFTDANVFFNPADVLRQILVTDGLVTSRYRITSLVDEHTVAVVDAKTGIAPVFAGVAGLDWYLGRPTRTTTGVVVGGVPADVVKTVAGNYIVPWPIQALLTD